MRKILAVDPGDVRIGLAICDSSGTIARPLLVFRHHSRKKNAERILKEAETHGAEILLIGVALGLEGEQGPQARKALRLVQALQELTAKKVETWDESGSTQRARLAGKMDDMLDARAAAILLQEYLDATQT